MTKYTIGVYKAYKNSGNLRFHKRNNPKFVVLQNAVKIIYILSTVKIVNEYNTEIERCSTVFEYGNVLAKRQCVANAEKNFPTHLLDNEYSRMLESPITSEEDLIYSEKILEQIKKQNEEFYQQYPDLKP